MALWEILQPASAYVRACTASAGCNISHHAMCLSNYPLNKRLHGTLSSYLDIHLAVNHDRHFLNTRCTSFYAICPKYYRGTDSGPTFFISVARLRNNVPLSTTKVDSVTCFCVGSVVVWNCRHKRMVTWSARVSRDVGIGGGSGIMNNE